MYYGSAVQIDVADYLKGFSSLAVQAGFSHTVLAEVDGHHIPAFVRRRILRETKNLQACLCTSSADGPTVVKQQKNLNVRTDVEAIIS